MAHDTNKAEEIEATEEMLRSGAAEVRMFDPLLPEDAAATAEAVFYAMVRAMPRSYKLVSASEYGPGHNNAEEAHRSADEGAPEADEIEVTEEMVQAGARALRAEGGVLEIADTGYERHVFTSVYVEMTRAREERCRVPEGLGAHQGRGHSEKPDV